MDSVDPNPSRRSAPRLARVVVLARPNSVVVAIATRQVAGVKRLLNADVVRGTKVSDGIAVSTWPIELHAGEKPRVEWLLNDFYEIPYGCFVPERGEGLLVAGRCLSAEHEAVASARVTAQCFSYGHAIGHAAAISALEGVAPRAIDGTAIRTELNREGAQLA